jgi:hypothetical protein
LDASPLLCSIKSNLPHTAYPETPNHCTFTLKMGTSMFVETLDNSQHSTQLTPESQSYTLKVSHLMCTCAVVARSPLLLTASRSYSCPQTPVA